MAGLNLPVNVATTYPDDAADASIAAHQQHHDAIHRVLNAFDSEVGTATVGQALVFDGTRWIPGAPPESINSTIARDGITATFGMTSGMVRFAYFWAKRTELVGTVRAVTANAASGATTVARMALYEVDAMTGDGTMVASSAVDTTLFSTAQSVASRPLTTPFQLIQGRRYAGAMIIGGGTMPTVYGTGLAAAGAAAEAAMPPRLCGTLSGQTDLPATLSGAALAASALLPYMAFSAA